VAVANRNAGADADAKTGRFNPVVTRDPSGNLVLQDGTGPLQRLRASGRLGPVLPGLRLGPRGAGIKVK